MEMEMEGDESEKEMILPRRCKEEGKGKEKEEHANTTPHPRVKPFPCSPSRPPPGLATEGSKGLSLSGEFPSAGLSHFLRPNV